MSKSPKTLETKRGKVAASKNIAELRAILVTDLQAFELTYQKIRNDIVALETTIAAHTVTLADHEARIVVLEP